MAVEQQPIVAPRGRTHMTEGVFSSEEELQVVGATVAEFMRFADHAKDICLIQQSWVHRGAYFVWYFVLLEQSESLAETIEELAPVR